MKKRITCSAAIILFVLAGLAQARSNVRYCVTLNEVWRFHKGKAPLAKRPAFDDSKWEIVNLPHTWNADDVYDEPYGYYRGIGWYRRTLELGQSFKDKRIFLFFEGAGQLADLFVNGSFVGRHIGGYTAFCFEVTDYVEFGKGNIIAVQVDNSHNEDIPPLSADFTFFGGIYRDVFLIATEGIHFDLLNHGSSGVFVETPVTSKEKAEVKVSGKIVNQSDKSEKIKVETVIKDHTGEKMAAQESEIQIAASGSADFTHKDLVLNNPRLWSPENPYLYTVETQVYDCQGNRLDEVINPLGVRWFRFDPEKGFFLNDEHCRLIGANRHQDFKHIGNALPNELHYSDMRLLKEMGGNFIRIAHYPQDPAILDACDKLGIIAWEEIPIVNRVTPSAAFDENCKTMLREMIRQHYNHPSVMMWGYMNEVFGCICWGSRKNDDEQTKRQYKNEVLELTKKLERVCREEDPTRVTVIAHHGDPPLHAEAGLVGLTMVTGWNVYYGWYSPGFENFGKMLDKFHQQYPDVPIIVSEYGAGSDPRIHTYNPIRFDFSIEWQQEFHKSYIKQILERPYVAGASLWNFVDFSSEGRRDAVPHINSKGILNWDRSPKDIYYFYKAKFSGKPVLKIASTDWKYRAGIEKNGVCNQKIKLFSNLKEVELLHNNKSLGKKKVQNNEAVWDVSFTDGTNLFEAIAKDENGKTVKDFHEIEFQLLPSDFKNSPVTFKQININIGSHFYFTDELTKEVWVSEKQYSEGGWGYIGGQVYKRDETRVGTDKKIYGTADDPVFQTLRSGIEKFRLDVPDGEYEVTLCFAELNHDLPEGAKNAERIFDVLINDNLALADFNLSQQYGAFRAVDKKFIIKAENNEGIQISFVPEKGTAILNGLKARRLF